MEGFPQDRESYWLTRFVILRLLGTVYVIAFLVAVQQLVPLVGSHGLTPAPFYLDAVARQLGTRWDGFFNLPSLFWLDCSDTALRLVPWIGLILACAVAAGFANSIIMAVLWVLYMSIVHVGQDWWGFGWEIQLLETGFLAVFLVPLLDLRPFPRRPAPYALILLFRWLIVRVMLGSALIKLRGDASWHDLTALNYFFETQPIPNALSVYFHFLPHSLLAFGTILTFVVELICPWFAFGPRPARIIAGLLMIGFQIILIICGNLSFFNWLTIVPALACLDDRFLRRIWPQLWLQGDRAQATAQPSTPMLGASWALVALIGLLSIKPVLNLMSSRQAMNTSFDPLELVNTYGAFGTVGQQRDVLVFEGTNSPPDVATDWKEYRTLALPGDPRRRPVQIAPYQPHLDWQLWFAAMGPPEQYPWAVNLVWKLLHNDPSALTLLGSNPFPEHPPQYIRVVHFIYHFAKPGNTDHVYWTREQVGLWLPPISLETKQVSDFLQQAGMEPQL